MAGPLKMKLKLNTGQGAAVPKAPASQTSTPSTGIRLNFSKAAGAGSPPAAASPPPPPSTTTLKLKSSTLPKTSSANAKKRARDDDTDVTPVDESPAKKQANGPKLTLSQKPVVGKTSVIKLKAVNGVKTSQNASNPAHTRLKIKARGKIPPRPLGVGYDSEAEDAELDPANEDNIILRMAPGADCEYLRNAIEERKVGLPLSQGGADVSMRFFTRDGRRAVVNVLERHYAAILVDLPCIVESMKSWDKRGWWKSADICQMLLVLGQVPSEEAAKTFALPRELDPTTWQWPHGLTPPMHNVRRRRFRKRVSNRTIEAAEEEVERLLAADEQARAQNGSVELEILDLDAMRREEAGTDEDDDEDADGDGDVEYFVDEDDEQATADMVAMMQQALEAGDDDDTTGLPAVGEAERPPAEPTIEAEVEQVREVDVSHADAETDTDVVQDGANNDVEQQSEDDDEEEDDEDEEALEVEESEIDEHTREEAQKQDQLREEIAYLEQQVKMQQQAIGLQGNELLKFRLMKKITSLEADLQVKRRALGIADDDV